MIFVLPIATRWERAPGAVFGSSLGGQEAMWSHPDPALVA